MSDYINNVSNEPHHDILHTGDSSRISRSSPSTESITVADLSIANEFLPYNTDYSHYNAFNRMNTINIMNKVYNKSLTANSSRMAAPPEIKIPLKIHQEALLAEMIHKETILRAGKICSDGTTLYSRYAILGDAVGAGKSLVVLSHIIHMKTAANITTPPFIHKASNVNLFSLWANPPTPNAITTSLIVVPHTLFRQWANYIKTQTTLKVALCKNCRFYDDPVAAKKMISESHAVLVSNTGYEDLQSFAEDNSIKWDRAYIDEADTIHFPRTRSPLRADFIWFITATWAPVINIMTDYYTPFMIKQYIDNGVINLDTIHADFNTNFVKPSLERIETNTNMHTSFGGYRWQSVLFFHDFVTTHPNRYHLVIRTTDEFRGSSLALPVVHKQVIRCKATLQHQLVNGLLTPAVQAMMHAGDISGAMEQLGVEETAEISLVDAVMANQKKELLRLEQTLAFKRSLEYATAASKEAAIASLEDKIRSLKAQIDSFEERVNCIAETTCGICMEAPNVPVCIPCCRQIMCAACVLQWLGKKPACPMCREPLNVRELRRIVKEETGGKKVATGVAGPALLKKPDALLKIIKDNPTGKIIVFSRYENPFISIVRELTNEGVAVEMVRGSKDAVHSILQRFREGRTRVLLLNSNYCGSGLNIETASHVVLYHGSLSLDEHHQIVGRAQRLGRTEPLTVVQLLHEHEAP